MKRLLCFFDGTWNRPDAGGEVTNVVKLYEACRRTDDFGVRQVAHYEIGIATGKSLGRLTFAAGAVGYGVGERIRSGLRFLAENYEPGDQIAIFGFSRGAFQARSLAGLIALTGLPHSVSDDEIEAIWGNYEGHRLAPEKGRLERIRARAHFPVSIRCVGVWDTVGNLGIPFFGDSWINHRYAFHHIDQLDNIEVGLHALAIDEPRGPYRPSLWTRSLGRPLAAGQIVEQVWFPGSHADVGGGALSTGLSDAGLMWMAERAQQVAGIAFDIARLRRRSSPDPLGEALDPTSENVFRLTPLLPFIRLIGQDPQGIPAWRRRLFRYLRTNKVSAGRYVVNEMVHPSALARIGRAVPVRWGSRVTRRLYLPRTLDLAFPNLRIAPCGSNPMS